MDWGNFFNMGGYAFFVWGSYALALVVLGIVFLQAKLRLKKARQQVSK